MFESLSADGVIAAALIAPPSAELLAALDAVDVDRLDDRRRVDLMIAWDRLAAWVAAVGQRLMVRVGADARAAVMAEPIGDTSLAESSAHAEIGAALRLPEQTAGNRLHVAEQLCGRLFMVGDALAAGDITFLHAAAIAESTADLSEAKARRVAIRVLPRARRQTVAQLRDCLRRAVIAVEPRSAADRAKKAHAERSLDIWPQPDGMAELRLTALAADVKAAYAAADSLARHRQRTLPKRGEAGWLPIAALRADALLDLITHGRAGSRPAPDADPAAVTETAVSRSSRTSADVLITIDLPTALGLADNPAELDGYGPIPAPLARTAGRRRPVAPPHPRPAHRRAARPRPQPLPALRCSRRLHPGPRPHLQRALLPALRPPLRPRPHQPLPPPPRRRRRHRPDQPRPRLRHPPPAQNESRLDATTRPQHHSRHLDHPQRPQLHQPPLRLPPHHRRSARAAPRKRQRPLLRPTRPPRTPRPRPRRRTGA